MGIDHLEAVRKHETFGCKKAILLKLSNSRGTMKITVGACGHGYCIRTYSQTLKYYFGDSWARQTFPDWLEMRWIYAHACRLTPLEGVRLPTFMEIIPIISIPYYDIRQRYNNTQIPYSTSKKNWLKMTSFFISCQARFQRTWLSSWWLTCALYYLPAYAQISPACGLIFTDRYMR